MSTLELLHLCHTDVTDAGLLRLGALALCELFLGECAVSGAGVAALRNVPRLTVLAFMRGRQRGSRRDRQLADGPAQP